jgi:cell division protein FtsB
MFKRIPSFLYNKYLLALVAFLVWLTFFDRNNFISQVKYGRTLNKQRKQKEFYKSEIVKDSIALVELSDSARLEKFAREKYLFKKDNEDIFIIMEEEKK